MASITLEEKEIAPEPHYFVPLIRFHSPLKPFLFYTPLFCISTFASLYFSPRPFFLTLILIFSGIFSWTFFEYFLHRYLFHLAQVTRKKIWVKLFGDFSIEHRTHHRFPNAKNLILAPPLVSFTLGMTAFLLFTLFTRNLPAAALWISGIFLGYCLYDWIHFNAHRGSPKTELGKFLKKYHLLHHHRYPNQLYGVTTPLWDFIFRTYPQEMKKQERHSKLS